MLIHLDNVNTLLFLMSWLSLQVTHVSNKLFDICTLLSPIQILHSYLSFQLRPPCYFAYFTTITSLVMPLFVLPACTCANHWIFSQQASFPKIVIIKYTRTMYIERSRYGRNRMPCCAMARATSPFLLLSTLQCFL